MNTLIFPRSGVTARFFAMITIVSLLLSALPAAFFVAEAATTFVSASNVTVDQNTPYGSGPLDVTGYSHFLFSLQYDAELLDGGDKFTFGWRDSIGEHSIETIQGKREGSVGDESGSGTYAFDVDNGVTEIELFAKVTANTDADVATIISLSLEGEVGERSVAEKKVTICHWSEDDQEFSLINVSVNSVGTAHGSAGSNDGDIIPAFDDYAGQNMTEMYGSMTGAEVLNNDCVLESVDPEPEPPTVCSAVGTVLSYTDPAYRKDGVTEVSAARRHVSAIENGVAAYSNFNGKESTYNESDFFSLGLRGEVVYEFTDKVVYDQAGSDIAIWEITGGSVDSETNEDVEVLVSQNGVDFTSLGVFVGSAEIDIAPAGLDYVKFVKVIDQGSSNDDGYDVDAITIIDDSCGDVPPPPQMCTVKVVSDTSNTVVEKLGANAVLAFVHNAWVKSLTDADWIWGDALVVDPSIDETQTFINQFGWGLPSVTHATLTIAADNSFSATLNGSPAAEDLGEFNYSALKTYDVTSLVQAGNNEFVAAVKNFKLPGSSSQSNPAGLYYELEIAGEGEDCDVPYVPDPVDDAKPEVKIMYPEHGAIFYPSTIIATGTATDTDSGIVEVKYTITKIDGIGGLYAANVASGVASGTEAWEFPAFNLTPGFYRLKVQAFDAEGNWKYDYHDIQVVEKPRYENYCGDGEINQAWEQCDGSDVADGESCTEYCTLANQCADLRLVKITLDPQAPASESFDGEIYLGSASNLVPSGAWFNFDEIGDDAVNTIALNATGLAVERTASALRLAVLGDNAKNHFDYAFGRIETLGVILGALDRGPITGWPLENSGDYKDVFKKDGDTALDFKFWLTTGDDSAAVEVLDGEPYDCVECNAEVEARVVIRDEDGAEITTNGLGNLQLQVILGDGLVVPFGEWFKLSEATNPGDSAVWIDDAETVTNFTNPGDLEGLFVSREGNGQVKVALYGFHNPGGDTNYESLRATIEFNDAKVLGGSTTQIPGDYKLENHSEADAVLSNDNFDTFAESANLTSVDFDFWVDTAADGITITLDDAAVATCDEDTDPDPEPVDMCPNIQGDQETVPDGYEMDEAGNCVLPNVGFTCAIGTNLLTNGSFEASEVTNSSLWQKFSSVLGWGIEKVVNGDPTTLEVHRGWSGNVAADGAQYVELDGDESVRISQTVALEEGAAYELSWAFAPRNLNTATQNQLSVLLNNVEVATSGPATLPAPLAQTDWTSGLYSFIADATSGEVAFEDAGTPQNDSYGTFLDNAVLCKVAEPVSGCTDPEADNYDSNATVDNNSCSYEPDTYWITGHKIEVGDDYYAFLSGWTIELRDSAGEFIASTTTDSEGAYHFVVEAGVYQIHEVMQDNWLQNQVLADGEVVETDADYDYCTLEVPTEGSDYVCDFYNESVPEDPTEPPVITPTITTRSSGGGSGTRVRRAAPQVLGVSTSSFCPFIEDYMQIGWDNDSWEVTKLQLFLNLFKDIFGGTDNPINGTFDSTTDANVKAFQEHFRSDILNPWYEQGIVPHNRPTGFVYKTTRWKINDIVCPGTEAYPSFTGETLTTNIDIDGN